MLCTPKHFQTSTPRSELLVRHFFKWNWPALFINVLDVLASHQWNAAQPGKQQQVPPGHSHPAAGTSKATTFSLLCLLLLGDRHHKGASTSNNKVSVWAHARVRTLVVCTGIYFKHTWWFAEISPLLEKRIAINWRILLIDVLQSLKRLIHLLTEHFFKEQRKFTP